MRHKLFVYNTCCYLLTEPFKCVTHLLHIFAWMASLDEHFEIMGGKLHLYRRPNSSNWQCSTFLAGKNWRKSTKLDSFGMAKEVAEDWYLELRGKMRSGELKIGKTFKDAADKFLPEYQVLTFGERSPKYVEGVAIRLKAHLLPFFKNTLLSDITPGLVQEYRIHRMTSRCDRHTGEPKRPARSTLQQEIVVVAAGPENRQPVWLATISARSFRTLQDVRENWPPGMVLTRGIQAALRSDPRKGARTPKNNRWKDGV